MAPKKRKPMRGAEGAHNSKKARATRAPSTEMRVTRRMAVDMSRNAVFNTVELLENIVLHLPARDVLTVQGVSQRFRNVIASSTRIQQKLFFRTCAPKELWDLCDHGAHPIDADVKLLPHSETNIGIDETLIPASLCPLVDRAPGDLQVRSLAHRAFYGGGGNAATFNLRYLRRHCGSWRNMQLTDPPCETVNVVHSTARIASTPMEMSAIVYYFRLNIAGGITLGHIVDVVCIRPNTMLRVSDGLGPRGRPSKREGNLSVDEVCRKYRTDKGEGDDTLEALEIRMDLHGMVLPTSDEWAEMRKNGVLS